MGESESMHWLDLRPDSEISSPPDPAVRWLIARICSIAQDIEGRVSIVRRMKHYEKELAAARRELRNGLE